MPHRKNPTLAELIENAKCSFEKLAVFDREMNLLWWSEHWQEASGPIANPAEPLGKKWLEFVHPDDLPAVLGWCQAGDGARIVMRCASGNDNHVWLEVEMVKLKVGDYWLAVGENWLLDEKFLPGPDCFVAGFVALSALHAARFADLLS